MSSRSIYNGMGGRDEGPRVSSIAWLKHYRCFSLTREVSELQRCGQLSLQRRRGPPLWGRLPRTRIRAPNSGSYPPKTAPVGEMHQSQCESENHFGNLDIRMCATDNPLAPHNCCLPQPLPGAGSNQGEAATGIAVGILPQTLIEGRGRGRTAAPLLTHFPSPPPSPSDSVGPLVRADGLVVLVDSPAQIALSEQRSQPAQADQEMRIDKRAQAEIKADMTMDQPPPPQSTRRRRTKKPAKARTPARNANRALRATAKPGMADSTSSSLLSDGLEYKNANGQPTLSPAPQWLASAACLALEEIDQSARIAPSHVSARNAPPVDNEALVMQPQAHAYTTAPPWVGYEDAGTCQYYPAQLYQYQPVDDVVPAPPPMPDAAYVQPDSMQVYWTAYGPWDRSWQLHNP